MQLLKINIPELGKDEEPQNAKRARDTAEDNNSESELLGIDWY